MSLSLRIVAYYGKLLFSYDGNRLISLFEENCLQNVTDIFRRENLAVDQIDPLEMARFFKEVIGGRSQRVIGVGCVALPFSKPDPRKKALPPWGPKVDESRVTLPKPSVERSVNSGWILNYWALQHSGGCIPKLPKLHEYTICVSPQFEVTYQERIDDLKSKYALASSGEKTEAKYESESLIAALEDHFLRTRLEAISALGHSRSSAAIPALIRCLREDLDKFDCAGYSYRCLEGALICALSRIIRGSEVTADMNSIAPILVSYLEDKDDRYNAINALVHLRPAPDIAESVIGAIKSIRAQGRTRHASDPKGYREIMIGGETACDWIFLIKLLGLMDPPAASAIPFLEDTFSNEVGVARSKAFEALQSIWSGLGVETDEKIISFYFRCLADKESRFIRLLSIKALLNIEPSIDRLVSVLADRLSHPGWVIREEALDALAEIGPRARPALVELLGLGNSPFYGLSKRPVRNLYQNIEKIDSDGTYTLELVQKALAKFEKFGPEHERAIDLLARMNSPACYQYMLFLSRQSRQ